MGLFKCIYGKSGDAVFIIILIFFIKQREKENLHAICLQEIESLPQSQIF